MQKHLPYDRQPVAYYRVRREPEYVPEERESSDMGGSDAERGNSESFPVVCVL